MVFGHKDRPGEDGSHGDLLSVVLNDHRSSGKPLEAADEMAFDDAQSDKLGPASSLRDLNDSDCDSFFYRIERECRFLSQLPNCLFFEGFLLQYIRLI